MELLLTGIGQEVSLSNMSETNNFLLFRRRDGTSVRVHVPEDSIKELLTALHSDTAPPEKEAPEVEPPEQEEAAEFGGDFDGEEPPEEPALAQTNYIAEDDVPSL